MAVVPGFRVDITRQFETGGLKELDKIAGVSV
jgi:hypothetical protein